MYTTTIIDALDGSVIARREFADRDAAELLAEKFWLEQEAYTCVTDSAGRIVCEFEI